MDGRRQQRSIPLNHIPPLPIPHALEYPFGCRMNLVVVHPGVEARGQPFPQSAQFCSCVNLCVLRRLTQESHGQPGPLQTPHGRPRVQGIFPTSSGRVPHGWPMVHRPMATGLPIPQGCYFALSVVQFSPFPFATSCHWPGPRVPSLIPCFYPTSPPATQWRGPSDGKLLCAPCKGRSYPVKFFHLHGAFP